MPSPKADPLKFQAKLLSRGPGGAWTYLQIPFNVAEVFSRKGQVPVRATINGFAFRNSLMPRAGVHILGVGKDVLESAQTAPGNTVQVELAFDDAARAVEVPADLEATLAAAPHEKLKFDALSYSHKKEYIEWITSAKKLETRQSRIQKAVTMLAAGKTPKG
jgi:Bacteriocin-protection, YdeI or OmpD-Associated/Domain of unknown function (DUF1905)